MGNPGNPMGLNDVVHGVGGNGTLSAVCVMGLDKHGLSTHTGVVGADSINAFIMSPLFLAVGTSPPV